MTGLIDTINSWLTRFDKDRRAVAEVLAAICHDSSPVDLETDGAAGEEPFELTTIVRELRLEDGELVISQPYAGSRLQPLVTNQKLRIIVQTEEGLRRMNTSVLGRIRMNTPGGGTVYGYRLSLPGRMFAHERHRRVRPEVVLPDSCIEVQLRVLGRDAPIHGVLIDLTAASCQMRSTNARDRVEPGQEVLMKLQLPEPVGDVSEHVSVTRVNIVGDGPMSVVGLRFREQIPGLRELLASGRIRMAPARP